METRDKILSMLKENQEKWISGELLSGDLGISRAAVSKHIGVLRKTGYAIVSAPKKGYRFSGTADNIIVKEISQGLKTDRFGKGEILYFQETDSTNVQAKKAADRGAAEGTVVIADAQKRGRGRKGRAWFSSPGGQLLLSVVLRPSLPPMEAPKTTLMAAVAIAEALRSATGLDITIKWPNDLLINKKKLAGILTELNTEMDQVNYIILGVGININSQVDRFPEELRPIATSLFQETGAVHPRMELLQRILESLEACYRMMLTGRFPEILDRWKALSDIIGRRVTVAMIDRQIKGTVTDIDNDGVLILEDEKGDMVRVLSGDVIF